MKTGLPASEVGEKSPKPIVKKNLPSAMPYQGQTYNRNIKHFHIPMAIVSKLHQMQYLHKMKDQCTHKPKDQKYRKPRSHTLKISPPFTSPLIFSQFLQFLL